jgi:DNA-binding CsgD family transcriptional regulator
MALDHDNGQFLDTHAPRTCFGSPPHFTVAGERDATVVPLLGEEPGEPVGPPGVFGDSPSATAVRAWLVQSLLVEAILRDEAGQITAAERALERALELAARDRVLLPFVVDPVPDLLERRASRHTTHADLIYEIVELRAGLERNAPLQALESLAEPLTECETRILRLLATELSQREIADELYVSLNTVKTHLKHLYAKLDVRARHHAVERARSLGLYGRDRRPAGERLVHEARRASDTGFPRPTHPPGAPTLRASADQFGLADDDGACTRTERDRR